MKTNHFLSIVLLLLLFSAKGQKDSIRDVTNTNFSTMPSQGVVAIHPLQNGEFVAQTTWWNGEGGMRRRFGYGLGFFNDSSRLTPDLKVEYHAPGLGGSPALLNPARHYTNGRYVQVDNFIAGLVIYRPQQGSIDSAMLKNHRILSHPLYSNESFYLLATPTKDRWYSYQDSIFLFKLDEKTLKYKLLQKYPFTNHHRDLKIREIKIDFNHDSLYLFRYRQDSVFGNHGYPLYQAFGFSLNNSAVADTFKEYSKKYNALDYEFGAPFKHTAFLNHINKKDLQVSFKLYRNDSTVWRTLRTKLKSAVSAITYPVTQVSATGDTTIYIAGSDSMGQAPYPHRTILMAFDGKLNLRWRRNYLHQMNSWAQTLAADEEGNLLIGGTYSLSKTQNRTYSAFVMRVNPAGNKLVTSSSAIDLFPNPVQNHLIFEYRGEIKSYRIFTPGGTEQWRGETFSQGSQHRVNINKLEAGLYVLQFTDRSGRVQSIRFLKGE